MPPSKSFIIVAFSRVLFIHGWNEACVFVPKEEAEDSD